MRVVWTDRAKSRLRDIRDDLGERADKATGKRVARALAEASKRLAQPGMSLSGSEVPEYEDVCIRQVIKDDYRIIHVVLADRIDVLTVVHSRQMLPNDPDDLR